MSRRSPSWPRPINALIVPGDLSNMSGMIASALQVVKSQPPRV
jgi:hypothetical protein